MYEVELKAEITAEKNKEIVSSLINSGFSEKASASLTDYYIESEKSPHGGYNLKRYRNQDGKMIYAHKIWEMENGELARKEEERESSQKEFEEELMKSSNPITIKKNRLSFDGLYKDIKMHVDMDSIKFDHSPEMRYFVEAEIITEKIEDVKDIKEFIKGFLEELLGVSELVESPGMFTMAFEKR